MQPTLAAEEVRRNLTQYLTTTFALADAETREGLDRFLNHSAHGIFRGPYLRIRTPFRHASDGWRRHLDRVPDGFVPYRHQARAFERLSTRHGPALPTLITTGTGSGKTESFLLPVLDHCRRARAAGRTGVQAVLLYPMNALATDQAQRLSGHLESGRYDTVTAGLYIGDTPESGYPRVATERAALRRDPPDILITNYKMLDLLLQRAEDAPLWDGAHLTYVVVDEFHTYDGAQGTDVAMLLRRLAAVTGQAGRGRPLGDICPVATSATLGETDDAARIRDVAADVFGTAFDADSVITEERLPVAEFLDENEIDYTLPLPDPQELAAIPDPQRDPAALDAVAAAVTGERGLPPVKLGERLRRHILTAVLLDVLAQAPCTSDEILDRLPRNGAYAWGAAIRSAPKQAATALARFVALLSTARLPGTDGPDGTDGTDGTDDRPFLHIETHLWVRPVAQLLRRVGPRPDFAWHGEAPPAPEDSTDLGTAHDSYLPAVYCRHCGRSGWAAISPERDPQELITDPAKIYRAGVSRSKKLVRTLIAATTAEARAGADGRPDPTMLVLDTDGRRVRPLDPSRDHDGPGGGVFVLGDLRHDTNADQAARADRCPACGIEQGTRFIGSGPAALASVAITELFTGGRLPARHRKTLLFNDSVQDAAHRGGFVANRAYGFSLRSLLTSTLRAQQPDAEPVALNDLIAEMVTDASIPANLPAVVPPDLHDRTDIDALLSGQSPGSARTWALIGQRLAFATVLEFGLRSRSGRTLELTRTVAAEVALDEPDVLAGLARDLHLRGNARIGQLPGPGRYLAYLRGLLERLRLRGAISHHWLDTWLAAAGTRRFGTIWGNRADGMPAFARGMPAPAFLLDREKKRSEFDRVDARQGWYADWTARCLGMAPHEATAYLARLLPMLADQQVLATRVAGDGATVVYGLRPGHVRVRPLAAAQVNEAGVSCDVCGWEQTVHPGRTGDWAGHPCPRYRCTGTLAAHTGRDFTGDYYRRLYTEAEPFKVVTAEHTGALTRSQRERIERAFTTGTRYNDPNVLSCTPTLELGIDIGDLSTVLLASLPRRPANYVQRAGRAGRRSGNALLLTMVGRRARDRYYLAEPRDMIAGEIVPPGCYLSAVEILRRQYLAHLVDLAARGRLAGVLPMPRLASAAFGASGWLAALTEAATAEHSTLADGFLALFGDAETTETTETTGHITVAAADRLRDFAAHGLADAVEAAERTWSHRLDDLRGRLTAIDAARAELVDTDPVQRAGRRELNAERRAVATRVSELGRADAHGTLVELGLLPNYSLIDTSTALEATLTWREENADGDREYHSELREYTRPAGIALTELAPGNFFYIRGYRHEITGVDIGTPSRPGWTYWRVCPECGYVRTAPAATDTAACPRCGEPRIADRAALHKVVTLSRVTAHDRRDDARIRDDADERRHRYYHRAVAIDVAPEHLEPGSWRHARRTFGVDFTRRAAIRRFNLGQMQADTSDTDLFAGQETQLNPFRVCASCGGVPDDGPQRPQADPLTGSRGESPSHHRPWCPQRRVADGGPHEAVILAHELRTEALRILLPVADTQIAERVASFSAALMAGVSAKYGGHPDHLDVEVATMPDGETGRRRRFLVLYDTLPGGTGYLHRLADEAGFRAVLELAHRIVARCGCAEQGKRACHRCLLAHTDDDGFAVVDRALAEQMLGELLADWQTGPVHSTHEISLWDQVESELERRFLGLLLDWARRDPTATLSRVADTDGRVTADLRIETGDGPVVHWQMLLQNTIRGTRPDVLFRRLDAPSDEVAVYLDGYRYHAVPQHNRLADDAGKRARLRAHGRAVFQLTWDDMRAFASGHAEPDAAWLPYQGTARLAAQGVYQEGGGDPAELAELIWTNPMTTLLAFLTDPDRDRWRRRAEAAIGGLLRLSAARTTCPPDSLAPVLDAALRDAPLPSPDPGALGILRVTDANGCPLTLIADQRAGTGAGAWSALVVLDDRTATIKTEPDAPHRRRWAAWLYWGNLVQFLGHGAGDGCQLVVSALDDFDPAVLAAAGGAGLDATLSLVPLDDADLPAQYTRAGTEPARTDEVHDPAWREVYELVDPEESGLLELVGALAGLGVPAPQVGFELGAQAWQAEVAWPDRRIAVVLTGADDESANRDAAFAAAGWEVRHARDWTPDELSERINGGHR